MSGLGVCVQDLGFKGESMLAEIVSVENEFDVTYRGTLLMRKTLFLGPYSRTIPRVLW